jgi:hypothetical protein
MKIKKGVMAQRFNGCGDGIKKVVQVFVLKTISWSRKNFFLVINNRGCAHQNKIQNNVFKV